MQVWISRKGILEVGMQRQKKKSHLISHKIDKTKTDLEDWEWLSW